MELHNGTVGLIAARNINAARSQANREEGASNVKRVRLATQAEVDWVQGFGGHVPPGRVGKPKSVNVAPPKGALLKEALTKLREAEREGRYSRANELEQIILETCT